ncbi:hypothetical protein QVD17_15418 [Tagetes erecta]|uniref:Elongation factor P n=1 Tax=Tagetes erecta TaxID=13708 RepID=A0AAD8NZN6_TARER|nr:hypothetical protein QVD17_15418 [Tagetes erecta]
MTTLTPFKLSFIAPPIPSLSFSSTKFAHSLKFNPRHSTFPRIYAFSSNDIKVGSNIEVDGSPWKVIEFLHVKPGKGAAYVRTTLRNHITGNSVEKTFRAGSKIEQAEISKETKQFTYKDGSQFVFMDLTSYEEVRLNESDMGDKTKWLKEGMDCILLFWKGKVIDFELPIQVKVKVVEVDPGLKGDTAQGGSKPATVETGAVVSVPLFVERGQEIIVDTRTGQYRRFNVLPSCCSPFVSLSATTIYPWLVDSPFPSFPFLFYPEEMLCGMMAATVLSIKILENMFMTILHNCKTIGKLNKIHAQIIKFSLSQSSYLVTKMVNICDQHEQLDYANLLFKEVYEPNVYLYNAIIKAHTHRHLNLFTVYLYKKMLKEAVFPDNFTYPFVVRSCGGICSLDLSKQVHGHVFKFGVGSNSVVVNSLLDMYVKCDGVDDAYKVFDEMSQRDVICWNSLLYGYIKLGQMKRARQLFDEMPERSVVSWTAMISGYARNGSNIDALQIFHMMQLDGVKPDWISLLSVLPACTQVGALELGKWIHFYAEKNGFLRRISLCNALIEMYAKSGNIDQAWQVFDNMVERDVISWSTMVVGLANHGKASEAIRLFQEMQKTAVKPNEITFVGLLSACAHAGLLQDGLRYFNSMTTDYSLEPGIEHYGCLVDLLGRTGCLDQAFELIKTMPMKPDSAIWGSLLSSCRIKGNADMAVIAMEHLLELEPEDVGNYVLLSNIYADLGRWDGVSRVRKLIRGKITSKKPGCSSIEVDNVVEEFVSGDESKPFSGEVYSMLRLLVSHQTTSEIMGGEMLSF